MFAEVSLKATFMDLVKHRPSYFWPLPKSVWSCYLQLPWVTLRLENIHQHVSDFRDTFIIGFILIFLLMACYYWCSPILLLVINDFSLKLY